jgi:ribonuclease P protein component
VRWYRPLRHAREIAYVRRRGRSAGGRTVVGYAAAQAGGPSRIAVTVTKAVGGAVVRNRVRRRIKGVLDSRPALAVPARIVFVARPGAAGHPYAGLVDDVNAVLARLAVPEDQ